MGRVLRAYDRASLASVYAIDEGVRTVRAIDDRIWEETEDKAYLEDAEYDGWKRQAEEELADYEERLRLKALQTLYPLVSGAGGDEYVIKRAKREMPGVVIDLGAGEEEEEEEAGQVDDDKDKGEADDGNVVNNNNQ